MPQMHTHTHMQRLIDRKLWNCCLARITAFSLLAQKAHKCISMSFLYRFCIASDWCLCALCMTFINLVAFFAISRSARSFLVLNISLASLLGLSRFMPHVDFYFCANVCSYLISRLRIVWLHTFQICVKSTTAIKFVLRFLHYQHLNIWNSPSCV